MGKENNIINVDLSVISALKIIRNPHIGFEDSCMDDAIKILDHNQGSLLLYVPKTDLPAMEKQVGRSTQKNVVVYEGVRVIPTQRREGPLFILDGIGEEGYIDSIHVVIDAVRVEHGARKANEELDTFLRRMRNNWGQRDLAQKIEDSFKQGEEN
ncbi:hypothetical protein A2865_04050 [Candidatus Woesebacteria bacterium RIFCSPHIGHO2_01_FULL_39_17]|uniref:Uncharacterized protein n=3 Tax=Candidatus Woeseibacteriota TaxID=1752722 RepID=A0A0G0NC01_9BACT|nr:MAG: hypothetical protein US72_C0012G0002 [Microgenomates group bacterium GW2011_GWC1_38_12]KKQ93497.1 MAG: hypothetical protein UT19_C0011G0042 [Candidatus Woesebacteria bacterium GW2011_GWB1_39_10b]KKR13659.1 MAG: hypothetical protein UT40_C0012G0025 [Candidatus Woesebacteria bacterium GW2011_GWA1_39_21b]OGM23280.1 MAG: hypothetical protein A2865_04050 [Candidatus Woesebacteria bacterium RIFCSPHIGHO2_01_FULL_39_17]OGM65708.1 MAG: hypothetical protein A3A52_05270 [Candidatus Woesebacteria b